MKEYNLKNKINPTQKSTKGIPRKLWTKEEVISKLKEIESSHGYVSKTLLEKLKTPTPKVIYRFWQTFYHMYEETGIKQKITDEPFYPREELILELKRLYSLYKAVTYDIIITHSKISYTPFYREFKTIESMYKSINKEFKREHYLSKSSASIISILENILKESALLEFTDNRIRNPKTNRKLRVDAYFPKHNLAVEIHGLQHYKASSYFFKNEKEFKYRKALDRLKRMQLKKYKFKYLELKYSLSENTITKELSKILTNQ